MNIRQKISRAKVLKNIKTEDDFRNALGSLSNLEDEHGRTKQIQRQYFRIYAILKTIKEQ
jgi:hypothetical protein